MKIKGGYYIKARQIQESFIMVCQPCVREIWDWLLKEANHKPSRKAGFTIERGQLLRMYSEIREALHWKVGYRKMRYSEDATKQAMKLLRDLSMITTKRTRAGTLITVLNYDRYQNPNNYENAYAKANEDTDVTPKSHLTDTSYINKNVIMKESTIVLRNYFCQLFKLKTGSSYLLDFAKDSAILKRLNAQMDVDTIKGLMRGFFESEDEFIKKAGYTVGVFKSQINKLQMNKKKPTMRKL